MSLIVSIISKYFLEGLMIFLVGGLIKSLKRQFGHDRTEAIKDAVVTAMLYAEEVFGIGHGGEKWTKAWAKIIELLKVQGIKLTEKEVPAIRTMMKATVPEVNMVVYSALPDILKSSRSSFLISPAAEKMVNDLRKKHKVKKS